MSPHTFTKLRLHPLHYILLQLWVGVVCVGRTVECDYALAVITRRFGSYEHRLLSQVFLQ
jgi:hypothetical protein